MKKFTSRAALTILMATFVLLPSRSISAETVDIPSTTISNSIVLSFKDKSGAPLSSGSYITGSEITVNWTRVAGAEYYSLYVWSDTNASGVRLLDTTQVSSTAKPTEYVTNSTAATLPRDGSYYYTVKALDESKAEIAVSETVGLTLDRIRPRLSVTNPKFNQEIIGNSLIVNGTVSDINLDYYYFILRNSTGEILLTSSRIEESVLNGVIANLDINTYLSGLYEISFIALDKAGNQSSITDADETASFIVLRKGDGNSFSNPPRPQEPAPTAITPIMAVAVRQTTNATPEFRLVNSPSVLGSVSKPARSVDNVSQNSFSQPKATIIAVAKNPAKTSSDKLYLALLPMTFALILFGIKRRQTVSNNFSND